MQNLTNTIIDDKYQILSLCGVGGVGAVYRAKQLSLGRMVALKFYGTDNDVEDGMRQRFQHEAAVLANLHHKNICAFYEYGRWEKFDYFAMEWVNGQPLSVLLTDNQFDLRRGLGILRQVASGMQHVHQHGIVHRDLKPANIMVKLSADLDDEVKVIDFGFAKLLSAAAAQKLTSTGNVVGTVAYMSPEQCVGGEVTARSDIYSFGCILYELMFCKKVFGGSAPAEMMMHHMSTTPYFPPAPSSASAADLQLRELLSACLQKKPEDRIQSFDEVMEVLDGVNVESLSSARDVPSDDVVVPSGQNRVRQSPLRGLIVATAVILGASGMGFIYHTFFERPADSNHFPSPVRTVNTAKSQLSTLAQQHDLKGAEAVAQNADAYWKDLKMDAARVEMWLHYADCCSDEQDLDHQREILGRAYGVLAQDHRGVVESSHPALVARAFATISMNMTRRKSYKEAIVVLDQAIDKTASRKDWPLNEAEPFAFAASSAVAYLGEYASTNAQPDLRKKLYRLSQEAVAIADSTELWAPSAALNYAKIWSDCQSANKDWIQGKQLARSIEVLKNAPASLKDARKVLLNVVNECLDHEQYKIAHQAMDAALSCASPEDLDNAKAYVQYADRFHKAGVDAAAYSCFKRAIAIAEAEHDDEECAAWTFEFAKYICPSVGKVDEGEASLERLVKRFEASNPSLAVQAIQQSSDFQWRMRKNIPKAFELMDAEEKLASKVHDDQAIKWVSKRRAWILTEEGRYSEAVAAMHGTGLDDLRDFVVETIEKKEKNVSAPAREATLCHYLCVLANLDYQRGDFDAARKSVDRALALAKLLQPSSEDVLKKANLLKVKLSQQGGGPRKS